MAASSNPAQFGIQLANALQVIEQLPNPLVLLYNYFLQITGEERLVQRTDQFCIHNISRHALHSCFIRRSQLPHHCCRHRAGEDLKAGKRFVCASGCSM